jgi:hypothetical protein
MRVLEELDHLVVGVTDPVEGLLTVFLDAFLEEYKESFLSNLIGGSNGGFQGSVELDSSLIVAFVAELAFNGSDSLLVAALRRETVETELAI